MENGRSASLNVFLVLPWRASAFRGHRSEGQTSLFAALEKYEILTRNNLL
jgi:hypothetical protein